MKYFFSFLFLLSLIGCQNKVDDVNRIALLSDWDEVKMDHGVQVSTEKDTLKISKTNALEKWKYNGIKLGPIVPSSECPTLTQLQFKVKINKGYVMFFLSAHGANAIFRSRLGGEASYITSNEESTEFKPMSYTSYPGFGNEADEWNTMSILYVPSEKKTYLFINEKPLSIYPKYTPQTYFWQGVSTPDQGNDFVLKTKNFSSRAINVRRASSYIDLFSVTNDGLKFNLKRD